MQEIVSTEKKTTGDLRLPEFRDDGSIPQMSDYKWPEHSDEVKTKIELLIEIWQSIESKDMPVGAFKRRLFGYRWLGQWIVTDKAAVEIVDAMLGVKYPFPAIEKHKYKRMEEALRHASLNLTPLIRSRSVRAEPKTKTTLPSSSSPLHPYNRFRRISDKLDFLHKVSELKHAGEELSKTPYPVRQPSKSRPHKALSSPNSPTALGTIPEMMSTTATTVKEREDGEDRVSFPSIVHHQITPTSSFGTVPDSSASA
jgi:hypothetical protein